MLEMHKNEDKPNQCKYEAPKQITPNEIQTNRTYSQTKQKIRNYVPKYDLSAIASQKQLYSYSPIKKLKEFSQKSAKPEIKIKSPPKNRTKQSFSKSPKTE